MDGYYDTRLLSRLKRSYDDRRNTLAWAMVVWVVTAVAFAFFLPIEPTILRSIGTALDRGYGWLVGYSHRAQNIVGTLGGLK